MSALPPSREALCRMLAWPRLVRRDLVDLVRNRSKRPLAPGSLPARQAGQGTATHAPRLVLRGIFLYQQGLDGRVGT
jgi:hypothetical protein